MINAVGIDLFGTLIKDKEAYNELRKQKYELFLLQSEGFMVDEVIFYSALDTVLKKWNSLRLEEHKTGNLIYLTLKELGIPADRALCRKIHLNYLNKFFSLVKIREKYAEFANFCKNKVDLYLLTNATAEDISLLKNNFPEEMSFFKNIFVSEVEEIEKPKINFYRTFFKKYSINPNNFLFVGNDDKYDGIITKLGANYVSVSPTEKHIYIQSLDDVISMISSENGAFAKLYYNSDEKIKINKMLNQLIKNKNMNNVLDVGGGDGKIWRDVSKVKITILDPRKTKHETHIEYIKKPFETFTNNEQYDLVSFIHSLFYVHWENVAEFKNKIKALLNSGGHMLAILPSEDSKFSNLIRKYADDDKYLGRTYSLLDDIQPMLSEQKEFEVTVFSDSKEDLNIFMAKLLHIPEAKIEKFYSDLDILQENDVFKFKDVQSWKLYSNFHK